MEPTGQFAYVVNSASNSLSGFQINPVTGTLDPLGVGPFSTGQSPQSVVIDPSGRFLYTSNREDGVKNGSFSAYNIDLSTDPIAMQRIKGSRAAREPDSGLSSRLPCDSSHFICNLACSDRCYATV